MGGTGENSGFLQIPVDWLPLQSLLSRSTNIVNEVLVALYAPQIRSILSVAPLRVWINPEDPSDIRIIDGLHRVHSAQRYNVTNDADQISLLPCIVERYSYEEFKRRRKEQTLAHGLVAEYRGIEWLIDGYEDESFSLSKHQKVPLEKILGLYVSTAKNPGTNILKEYKISPQQLDKMRNYVDEWISQYNIKGLAAVDIHRSIILLGKEDTDILGLPGMTRDYVKTAYGSLSSLHSAKEKRRYANHVLRLTVGLDKPRGWIQTLLRVVNEGDASFRTRILQSETYEEAMVVYNDFKNEHAIIQAVKATPEKPRQEGNEADILANALEMLDLDDESELPDMEPTSEELTGVVEEFGPPLENYAKPAPRTHKGNGARKNSAGVITSLPVSPYHFAYRKLNFKPGEQILGGKKSGQIGFESERVALLSGSAYITFNSHEERNFYWVTAPYLYLTSLLGENNPHVIASGAVECIHLRGNEANGHGPTIDKHMLENIAVKRNAGLAAAASLMNHPPEYAAAFLMRKDLFYSEQLRSFVLATPIEVLDLIFNGSKAMTSFLNQFGNNLTSLGNIYRCSHPGQVISILESVLSTSQ